MLSIKEVRLALADLKEKRENRELTAFAYDRQKERILQRAGLDEESGERHRYPTRRRLGISQKIIKKVEIIVEEEEDNFIDDRDSSDFTINSQQESIDTTTSLHEEEKREEHWFPKEIVIDCSSLNRERRDGKTLGFPKNFFQTAYGQPVKINK